MSEIFKEYLIKQKKSPKDTAAQMGLIFGGLIIACAALLFGGTLIGPLVLVGLFLGGGYLLNRLNREYEYILTNNELDIDVIYNRNARKRVLTFDMKKIQIMASIKDERYTSELNKPGLKEINASDNNHGEDTYAIITDTETMGMCKILITPNDNLLHELYKQAPNKVYKKNPLNKFNKQVQ